MKMHERLIPEWEHVLNVFCESEGVDITEIRSDSITQDSVKKRDRFCAFALVNGVSPTGMASATNRALGTVYHTFGKDRFRTLVQNYKKK